jgi:hypothetical protein
VFTAPAVHVDKPAAEMKLTVPISPQFRTRPASKGAEPKKLTSEEMQLQQLEQEKAEEAVRAAKARKLYKLLKQRAARRTSNKGVVKSAEKTIKVKKTLTRTVARVTNKTFVQPRKLVKPKEKGPGGTTLFEPFSFATDKRIPATEAPAPAVPSSAELAENFMRDSRSHGVSENTLLLVHCLPTPLYLLPYVESLPPSPFEN